MAITDRDILHTDMKRDGFRVGLSAVEKVNLASKLTAWLDELRSEVRRDTSERELHLAIERHHAAFGIKFALVQDTTSSSVQGFLQDKEEERPSLQRRQPDRGGW